MADNPLLEQNDPTQAVDNESETTAGEEQDQSQLEAVDAAPEREPADDSAAEEALARARGWVTKDKWRGGPNHHWVDAAAFNRMHERREPERLRRVVEQLQSEAEAMRVEIEENRKFREEFSKSREQIHIDTLRAQRTQALRDGDVDAFDRIDREIDELRASARAEPAPKPMPQRQPVDEATQNLLYDFLDENPQFRDPKLGSFLTAAGKDLRESGYQAKGREFLDAAKEMVMGRFPQYFQTPRRQAPMAETGGTTIPMNGRKRTWNDLKPDARVQFDNFIRTTPELSGLKLEDARSRLLANAGSDYFSR